MVEDDCCNKGKVPQKNAKNNPTQTLKQGKEKKDTPTNYSKRIKLAWPISIASIKTQTLK